MNLKQNCILVVCFPEMLQMTATMFDPPESVISPQMILN